MCLAKAEDTRLPVAAGPSAGTRESLRAYRIPGWFRDATFGIWAHWGPQSAAEYGDWYARNMYIQGNRQYDYHVKNYGHPTTFGFKDLISTWKADQFEPDHPRKGRVLYAFAMGWSGKSASFPELASGKGARVRDVTLPGHHGALRWKQEPSGLLVELPPEKPCEHAVAFRVGL